MKQSYQSLETLQEEIIRCERCLRLREYCSKVAEVKRRAYRDQVYWGKPVPGLGDPAARLVIVGLAPGAHGSNRTGRMFTGDRAGDFLYAALHRAGLCNQPVSISRQDGLTLHRVYITAAGRCAPPGNKPLPAELENCRSFLEAEFRLLPSAHVLLALGRIAFESTLRALRSIVETNLKASGNFSHGTVLSFERYILVSSYHVSQQNTQTGRLTVPMFDAVLQTCLSYF